MKISVDTPTLWPPNHKLVPIHVTLEASDSMSGIQSVVLTSITFNEPNADDIQDAEIGTQDTDFSIRAERSGNGEGRVNTVTYTDTDKAGHVSVATAIITVPHDQSPKPHK